MSVNVSEAERERRDNALRPYRNQGDKKNPFNLFTWGHPYRYAFISGGAYAAYLGILNVYYKKPWWFGFGPRVALLPVPLAVGWYLGKLRQRQYQLRDAIVDHYISLHPEDFENLNETINGGRKYRDILMPWYPMRVQEKKRALTKKD